jgi:toxin ParE1/3/4
LRIIWAPLAIDRASEEAAFIAKDKPEAAKRWLEGLFHTVDRLASFPLSGKRVPEIPNSEYRQLTYRSHRVVYSINEEIVAILTVRRFKQQLRPEDLRENGGLTPRRS